MGILVNDGGIWKDSEPYVRDSGVWKPVDTGFVRDGGVWKEMYASGFDPNTPIGTFIEGGYFAGVLDVDGTPYAHIVADKSSESLQQWAAVRTPPSSAPGSRTDSKANTDALLSSGTSHPAAQYCRSYLGGGFNDWDLPARDVLALCHQNLSPSGTTTPTHFKSGGPQAFETTYYYWTSTQFNNSNVWRVVFSSGAESANFKDAFQTTRPIRRVAI